MKNLDKVVYQIYPKSFKDTNGNGIGDIRGIISKIDHLASLSIDYLWLSPICQSPQKDNGYDISDYYTIDPIFGTNEDYYELIHLAKSKNINMMMDLVLNHVSDQHEWFIKAQNGDEYYKAFFILRDKPNELISAFKKSAWTYNDKLGQYYLHLFDSSQPDLNWDNENVRVELYKMINFWIDKGVTAFRLDVIDLIGKQPDKMIKAKGPKFKEYLNELVDNTFKDTIFTVGECWGSSLEEVNEMCGTSGLSQSFHFKHLLTTKRKNKWDHKDLVISELATVLNEYQNNAIYSEAIVMNNHDMPRLNSFWLDDDKYLFESSKLLVMLFGILKGTMYLYQGEEIGMSNANFNKLEDYKDVETLNKFELDNDFSKTLVLAKKISRDNARTPYQWDNTQHAGFTDGTPWIKANDNYGRVNLANQLHNDASVLSMYKSIIDFRKSNQDLINSKVMISTQNDIMFLEKESGLKAVYNFNDQTRDITVSGEILFNNYAGFDGKLKPYQALIYKA